nr:MAG TPA: hypothetical protein [Bacteriophage sp.]
MKHSIYFFQKEVSLWIMMLFYQSSKKLKFLERKSTFI